MTIESYLYRTDEYRSTTASIPFPLPLVPRRWPQALNERLTHDSELRSSLFDYLERHQVIVKEMSFEILSKPGYPRGGSKPTVTLQIATEHPESNVSHQWSPSKRGCQAILDERNIEAEVQIIDPKRAFIPTLLPIHPQDPHIAAYKSFRGPLLSYVMSELGDRWSSLCIYAVEHNHNVGRTYQIVLMVPPFTIHDWGSMTGRILNDFIKPLPESTRDIGVTIIPGVTSAVLADNEDSERDNNVNGKSFFNKLTPLPSRGASIGVKGERGGGTLGGYVDLKQGNKIERCILTNSHVVKPASTESAEVIESYLQSGVNVPGLEKDKMMDPRRSTVQWMAVKDVNVTRAQAERDIKSIHRTRKELESEEKELRDKIRHQHEAEPESEQGDWESNFQNKLRIQGVKIGALVETEEKKQKLESTGRDTTGIDKHISMYEAQSRHAYEVLSICKSMPMEIAKVYYASGAGVSAKGQILDFALAIVDSSNKKLREHSGDLNRLPQRPIFDDQEPEDFEDLDGPYPYPEKPNEIGSIIMGKWYYKNGRTTGVTVGTCHGIETYIRMVGVKASHRTKYLTDGTKESYRLYPYTSELVIITPKSRTPKDPEGRAFSQSGDSGSMVIGQEGNVDGLLYGFVCGLCGPPLPRSTIVTGEVSEKDRVYVDETDYSKATLYAAPSGLVMSMDAVQNHLSITAQGASLSLP